MGICSGKPHFPPILSPKTSPVPCLDGRKLAPKALNLNKKAQDSALKSPHIAPLKGLAIGRIGGYLVGNSSVNDVSEKGNDGEFVGELSGNSSVNDAP